ncbi:MAG TPA: ABC transporter ATP-binding protein [Dehalococcoidia bacterium]|nr:ABC transporter ATP-binding protein [Dehalococcoidia bacterium]
MRQIIRLYTYFKPYNGQLVLATVCVLGAGAFGMLWPLMVNFAIKWGLNPQYQNGDVVGIKGNEWLLVLACLAIIMFALGRGLAAFGQQYLSQKIGQDASYDIRNAIYDNLQSLSYAYHDKVQTGQVMSRITQDVESIRMFPGQGILRLLYIAVMLGIACVGMFWIDWRLALVSLITVPLMAWRSYVLSHTVRPIWLDVQANIAEITRIAEEALSGIRVVKAFSREDLESEQFKQASIKSADLSYSASKVQAVNQPLMAGLGSLQIAISMGFGAWQITQGNLSGGELLTFALWLNLLQQPVRQLGFSLNWLMRAISSSERIFELLDAQSTVTEKADAVDLENCQGHVRFEGVSFGYDDLSDVLTDINMEASASQVIALLGPPGSGKSTVVNLIPRFYDVTAGRITIDGQDIRDLTMSSLRKSIGIVQQDIFLFIGTIRENIAFGRPDASFEEVVAAAKIARIHDFIVSLPGGYDEWVGERGVTLSGGQKQRIAIARTLLLDPKILILDDSTASVDMHTEFLIQQALSELMVGRTTFVIAQRLRTIMRADEIVVLDHGKVVERGRHDDLIEKQGLYRRIFDLELKDQEQALGRVVPSSTEAS